MMYRLILAAVLLLCPVIARADTPMTISQLQNLFRDGQANGSITPLDMRDVIVSMLNNQNNLSDLTSVSAARTNLGLGTAALINTGTSGSLIPLLSGANTWSAAQTFGAVSLASTATTAGINDSGGISTTATLQGWVPTFGVRMDSAYTPAAAGTGNAIGDALTLSAGCTTNPVVTVATISGGGVTGYNITNPGNCLTVPANPISVLSTTGAGTGATFNLKWAPIAANIAFSNAVAAANSGNLILGAQPGAFSGTESTFIGGLSATITSGNFITDVGIGNCGIGSGTTLQNASFLWCVGSNAGRNLANGASVSMFAGAFGSSASPNITGTENFVFQLDSSPNLTTGSNNAMYASSCNLLATGNGNVCMGYGSGLTTASAAGSVVIGGTPNGGQSTKGAECPGGSVCIGASVGSTNITGSNYVLIGPSVGNTTCGAGGIKTVLIGFNVDCINAGTSLWLNVDNAFLSSVLAPTIGSGFGTSPTIPHGSSSAAFQVNVGTGGTASTGTVAFNTSAPNGWACTAVDGTNPGTSNTVATPLTAGSITLTNYSRTSGTTSAWAASDIITVTCNGY